MIVEAIHDILARSYLIDRQHLSKIGNFFLLCRVFCCDCGFHLNIDVYITTVMPPLRSPYTPTTPAPSTSTPSTSTFSIPLEHANHEANPKLKAAVFQRLHPQVYLEKYLAEGVRVDGRGLSEEDEEEEEDETARDGFRSVYVNVGAFFAVEGSDPGVVNLLYFYRIHIYCRWLCSRETWRYNDSLRRES